MFRLVFDFKLGQGLEGRACPLRSIGAHWRGTLKSPVFAKQKATQILKISVSTICVHSQKTAIFKMTPAFKNKKDELRSFDCEIRAVKNDENGTFVEGVPVVFNKKCDMYGLYEEYIDPHALSKTDLKDVRFLVNHNTDMTPLARSRNNNARSTMQMEVQEDGLHIRVNLDTENNSDAKNLYSAIQRGDVSGMSFMFSVNGEKWENLDSDYPKRTITSIERIFEVSAVTWPAYEDTSIKARSATTLENAKQVLESKRAEEKRSEEIQRENEERTRALKLLELQIS